MKSEVGKQGGVTSLVLRMVWVMGLLPMSNITILVFIIDVRRLSLLTIASHQVKSESDINIDIKIKTQVKICIHF